MEDNISVSNDSKCKEMKDQSLSISPCSSYSSYKQMMNIRKKHKLMSKREKLTLIPELWIRSCENIQDTKNVMLENQKITEFLKNKMCIPSQDSDVSKISKRFSRPPVQTKINVSSKSTDANQNLQNSVKINSASGEIDQTFNYNLTGTENLNFNLPAKLDNVESKMSGTINPNQEMKVSIRYKTDNDLESIKDLSENLAVLNQTIDKLNEPLVKDENIISSTNKTGEESLGELNLNEVSGSMGKVNQKDTEIESMNKDNTSQRLSNLKMTTGPGSEHSSVYVYNFEKYNKKIDDSNTNILVVKETSYIYTSKNPYQDNMLLDDIGAYNSLSRTSLLEDIKGIDNNVSDNNRISLPNIEIKSTSDLNENKISNLRETSPVSSDPDLSIIITTTVSHSQPAATRTEVLFNPKLLGETNQIEAPQPSPIFPSQKSALDKSDHVTFMDNIDSKLMSKNDEAITENLNKISIKETFQNDSMSNKIIEVEHSRSHSRLGNDIVVESNFTSINVKGFLNIDTEFDTSSKQLLNEFTSKNIDENYKERNKQQFVDNVDLEKLSEKGKTSSLKIKKISEKNSLIDNKLDEETIADDRTFSVDNRKIGEEDGKSRTSAIDKNNIASKSPDSPTTNYNIRSSALSALVEQPLPLHNVLSPVEFQRLDDLSSFKSLKITENKTLSDYKIDKQFMLHHKIPEDKYQPIDIEDYARKALSKINRISDMSLKSKSLTFNNEIVAIISELNVSDGYLKKLVHEIENTEDNSIFGRSMKAFDNYVEYNSNTYREWKSLNKDSLYTNEKFLQNLSYTLYKMQMNKNGGLFDNEDSHFDITTLGNSAVNIQPRKQSTIDQQFLLHPKFTDDLYQPINPESLADQELENAIQFIRSSTSGKVLSHHNSLISQLESFKKTSGISADKRSVTDDYKPVLHDKDHSEPVSSFHNDGKKDNSEILNFSRVIESRTYTDKNVSKMSFKKIDTIITVKDDRSKNKDSEKSATLQNKTDEMDERLPTDQGMTTAEQMDDLSFQISKKQSESPQFYSSSACSVITDSNENMSEKAVCLWKGKKSKSDKEKQFAQIHISVDEGKQKSLTVDISGKFPIVKVKPTVTSGSSTLTLQNISTDKESLTDLNEMIEKTKKTKSINFAGFILEVSKLMSLEKIVVTGKLLDQIELDLEISQKERFTSLSPDSVKRLAGFVYFNNINTSPSLTDEEFIENIHTSISELKSKIKSQEIINRDELETEMGVLQKLLNDEYQRKDKILSQTGLIRSNEIISKTTLTTSMDDQNSLLGITDILEKVNFAHSMTKDTEDSVVSTSLKLFTTKDYTALVSEIRLTDILLDKIDNSIEVLNSQNITILSNASLKSLADQQTISNKDMEEFKDPMTLLHTPSSKLHSVLESEKIGYVPKISSFSIPIVTSGVSKDTGVSVLEIISANKYATSRDGKSITEDVLLHDVDSVSIVKLNMNTDEETLQKSLSGKLQRGYVQENFSDGKSFEKDDGFVDVSKIQIRTEDSQTETDVEIIFQKKVNKTSLQMDDLNDEQNIIEGASSDFKKSKLVENNLELEDLKELKEKTTKSDSDVETVKGSNENDDDDDRHEEIHKESKDDELCKDLDFDSCVEKRILDNVMECLLESCCNDILTEKCLKDKFVEQEGSPSCGDEQSDNTDHCSVSTLIDFKSHICFSSKVPVKISQHQEECHMKLSKSNDRKKSLKLSNIIYKNTEITLPNKFIKGYHRNLKEAQSSIVKNQESAMYNTAMNEIINNCVNKSIRCSHEDSITCCSDSEETIYEFMVPTISNKNQNPESIVRMNREARWPTFTKKKSNCIKTSITYHKSGYRSEIPHKRVKQIKKDGDFEIPPGGIFGRDFQEPKFTNFCCNICRTWINLGNRQIHMDECTKLNTNSSKETLRPKLKPRAIKRMPGVVCYICGKRFTMHSIQIHEKSCLSKWIKINCSLRKNDRKPIPIKPNFTDAEIEKYIEEQKSQGKVDYCKEDAINDLTFISSRNHIIYLNE